MNSSRFLKLVSVSFVLQFALALPALAEHNGGNGGGGRPAGGNSAGEDCAQRVRDAGCHISNNDFKRIEKNVTKCKQVKSNSGKTTLEAFLLDKSDKLIIIKTDGDGVKKPNCPVVKYAVDSSGIKDIKIIDNRIWMVSNDGQVYFMLPDESTYELKNSSGKSYSGVKKIGGVNGKPDVVKLTGDSFELELTPEKVQERLKEGKVTKLNYVKYPNMESVFNDR